MTATIVLIVVFVAGILLNAFFAGYETGFVSSNSIRVRQSAEREGDPTALRLLAYLKRPDRMLTVVLIGTNLALIMGTIAVTRLVGPLWATIIATPLFLIFGEIVPKSIFRAHPTRLSLAFLPVIRFFDALLLPLAIPTTWLSQRITNVLQEDSEDQDIRALMRSSHDVRVLVDESADKGAIEEEEKEMIHSVMDLQTRRANEIMVPRIDIQALEDSATRRELVALLTESGRTRIPVYHESIDEVVGIINAFTVLRDNESENDDITRFVRPVIHVHDTMRLDDVLKMMRDEKQSVAIVTDEYGGTDGLITLEDILEEIFGEIHDEYDREETSIRKVGPSEYLVEARTELEDLAEAIDIAIEDETVETVGGWIMRIFARIPHTGEMIVHGRFRITVTEAGPNYVANTRIEILPEPEKTDEQAE